MARPHNTSAAICDALRRIVARNGAGPSTIESAAAKVGMSEGGQF